MLLKYVPRARRPRFSAFRQAPFTALVWLAEADDPQGAATPGNQDNGGPGNQDKYV